MVSPGAYLYYLDGCKMVDGCEFVIAVPVLSGFLCYLYYLDGWRMVDGCDCRACIEWFIHSFQRLSGI